MIRRWMLLVVCIAIAFSGLALWTGSGTAQEGKPPTIIVNTLLDAPQGCPETCTLRHAIAQANPGDTIGFDPALTGTLSLTETLIIDKNLTIQGSGADVLQVDGGGQRRLLDVPSGITVTISGLTLQNGLVRGNGGALFNRGSLTLHEVSLVDNATESFGAQGGGAISNLGTLTITRSLLARNQTTNGSGGAILNLGTVTLDEVLLLDNTAQSFGDQSGGAIFNNGRMTITRSLLAGNHSPNGRGGAIYNAGELTVINSTFFENEANSGAGAIDADPALASLTLFSSTLANNHGPSGALEAVGEVLLRSTILANNPGDDGADLRGTVTSLGYNLIGNAGSTGVWLPTDLLNRAALLGELGDHGGSTFTVNLLEGSPALANGFCDADPELDIEAILTDQRGELRHVPCDIGAFEADAVREVVNLPTEVPASPTLNVPTRSLASPTATQRINVPQQNTAPATVGVPTRSIATATATQRINVPQQNTAPATVGVPTRSIATATATQRINVPQQNTAPATVGVPTRSIASATATQRINVPQQNTAPATVSVPTRSIATATATAVPTIDLVAEAVNATLTALAPTAIPSATNTATIDLVAEAVNATLTALAPTATPQATNTPLPTDTPTLDPVAVAVNATLTAISAPPTQPSIPTRDPLGLTQTAVSVPPTLPPPATVPQNPPTLPPAPTSTLPPTQVANLPPPPGPVLSLPPNSTIINTTNAAGLREFVQIDGLFSRNLARRVVQQNGQMALYDGTTGAGIAWLGSYSLAAFDATGSQLAASDPSSGTVALFIGVNGQPMPFALTNSGLQPEIIQISDFGTLLLCQSNRGLAIYRFSTGELLGRSTVPVPCVASLDARGERLATTAITLLEIMGDNPNGVQIWPVTGLQVEGELRSRNDLTPALVMAPADKTDPITAVTFSPNGSFVALGTLKNRIFVWDLTGQTTELLGHNGPITGLAFSPDGTLLASASEDSTVRVWDVKTGQTLAILNIYGMPQFSSDGQVLMVYDGRRTVMFSTKEATVIAVPTATATPGLAGNCLVRTGSAVNLRGGPSTDSEIVGRLEPGEALIADGFIRTPENFFWVRVTTGAWVRADLITLSPEEICRNIPELEGSTPRPTATQPTLRQATGCIITASSTVNLRSGPSNYHTRLGQLVTGQQMGVSGYSQHVDGNLWWQLVDSSWVRADLVTPNGECGSAALPYVELINGLPANRFLATAEMQMLRGGFGRSDGSPMGVGEVQVEYYCRERGYGIREDGTDWFCTSGNQNVFALAIEDFDQICRDTYNRNDAFMMQTGPGTAPAFRWRCYTR